MEALHENGYNSLKDLETFPPNPMEWNMQQWNFVTSVISKGLGIPREDVRKFQTAADILRPFHDILRKTGLIIELERFQKVSERELFNRLASVSGKDVYVNVVGK